MENKPEYTLENLLEQVSDTLQLIQNHEGPIKMTPDLLVDIETLKNAVTNFKEDSQEIFERLNIDSKELEQKIINSDEVRSSDKQLLKRAKDIEVEAKVMKLVLTQERKRRRKNSPAGKSESEKRQIKERKKLFKTIGGDQKWIPL